MNRLLSIGCLILVFVFTAIAQMLVKNSANQEIMRVTQDKRVGIGNTEPKAHVSILNSGGIVSNVGDWPPGEGGYDPTRLGLHVRLEEYDYQNVTTQDAIRGTTVRPNAIPSSWEYYGGVRGLVMNQDRSTIMSQGMLAYSMVGYNGQNWGHWEYGVCGTIANASEIYSLADQIHAVHAEVLNNSANYPNFYSLFATGAKSYFGGKVGIGHTNPDANLHVYVDGGPATIFLSSTSGGYCELQMGVGNMAARYNSQQNLYLISDTDNNDNDATAYGITFACNNYEIGVGAYKRLGQLYENGNLWILGNCSAESFTDRTPYPQDVQTAYAAVFSMKPLPEGQYQSEDKSNQLDHGELHPFIRAENGERDLSATVSAQNEVIKDLARQVAELKAEIAALKKGR